MHTPPLVPDSRAVVCFLVVGHGAARLEGNEEGPLMGLAFLLKRSMKRSKVHRAEGCTPVGEYAKNH